MRKIELDIIALSHSVSQSHNYAVILQERNGARRLPIVIGGFEAQAIAVAMERMVPNRPLSHDLFKNALETFHIDLKEIIINNLAEGIFYARLVCVRESEVVEIDSRTSDALAMAVRFNCPIFTYEFILDEAGVIMEDVDDAENSPSKGSSNAPRKEKEKEKKTRTASVSGGGLSGISTEELHRMLDEVLASENYERAAEIRDEIKRRQTDAS